MKVLPVLDLKGGKAVHAKGGARDRYELVHGVFGDGSDPVALAERIRRRLGLEELYVADLDALQGQGDQSSIVAELTSRGFRVWLDAGVRSAADLARVAAAQPAVLIFALETVPDRQRTAELRRQWLADYAPEEGDVAFSIDLQAGRPVPNRFLQEADPVAVAQAARAIGFRHLILLDLAAVGSARGIAAAALVAPIRTHCPEVRLYGGGGVRGPEDLAVACRAGFDGLLIATALHNGQIGRDKLQLLET